MPTCRDMQRVQQQGAIGRDASVKGVFSGLVIWANGHMGDIDPSLIIELVSRGESSSTGFSGPNARLLLPSARVCAFVFGRARRRWTAGAHADVRRHAHDHHAAACDQDQRIAQKEVCIWRLESHCRSHSCALETSAC